MTTKDTIDRIVAAHFELGRVFRQRMICLPKANGIQFPQIHALTLIQGHQGMTMKELAGHLHISSPSATSFVNRLVRLKLVKRLRDEKNRKLVRLKVTAIGLKELTARKHQMTEALREVVQRLNRAEQEQFARILEKLIHIQSV